MQDVGLDGEGLGWKSAVYGGCLACVFLSFTGTPVTNSPWPNVFWSRHSATRNVKQARSDALNPA